jgi:hypothetical protein
MKKQIVTIVVAGGAVVGAMAQGSINPGGGVANDPGVTIPGANAISPANATTWYTGTVDLSVYYVSSATATQLNAINAEDGVAGGASIALALLSADGFNEVSATTTAGSTIGSVVGTVNDGTLSTANNIGLVNVPTDTAGVLAILTTEVGGADPGWASVIAFANNTGGNPTLAQAGTAASLTGWGTLNQNMVLNSVNSVPEPGTMALSALGGLSLFFFRRKN